MPGQTGAVKQELVVSRIASRLGLKEETVWGRLRELRALRRGSSRQVSGSEENEKRSAPASPRDRQLLQLLLAEPELVARAVPAVAPAEVEHPGLRSLLEGLYALHQEGEPPTLDQLRTRIPHPALMEAALELLEIGRAMPDRARSARAVAGRISQAPRGTEEAGDPEPAASRQRPHGSGRTPETAATTLGGRPPRYRGWYGNRALR